MLPACVCKLPRSRLTPCGEFVHDGLAAHPIHLHQDDLQRGGDEALDAYYHSGDGGYACGAASSSSDGGLVGFGDGGTPQDNGGGSASCCSGTPAPLWYWAKEPAREW